MQATLAELAALVAGRLVGDGKLLIHGAAPLCIAGPGEITLIDGEAKNRDLAECRAAAAIVARGSSPGELSVVQVEDVHQAFAMVVTHFRPPRRNRRIGVSPLAVVSPLARLAEDVDIHPTVTVGDDVVIGERTTIHGGVHIMAGCQIGPDVTIFPNAVLYEDTVVGPRCVIHAGAVLGAYGFGYAFVEGHHELSPQLGNVVLGPDVEIGAGSTVDRGTYGPTSIGEGTKIDDLVMVAHNCCIGRHNMLCSQVGIAGSTTTGDYVVMAGQVGVRDHVHIGNGAVLGAMAGVSNDVPAGNRMIGIPATPEREQKIKQAALSKLPEMRRQMKRLQAAVDKLAQESAARNDGSTSENSKQCRAVA
ncbi:MAG: UDP-3-O-(3-hydroxymyristoyl)glucosamine N-acyltransferase [Pirellulales bacterium]|nr:UDP-3-O-(3-hydroxymyristoyl)glucosamine N-acyltransferase [Pirellulales bacterium]